MDPARVKLLSSQLSQLEAATATTAAWSALSPQNRDEATRRGVLIACRIARLLLDDMTKGPDLA